MGEKEEDVVSTPAPGDAKDTHTVTVEKKGKEFIATFVDNDPVTKNADGIYMKTQSSSEGGSRKQKSDKTKSKGGKSKSKSKSKRGLKKSRKQRK